jgi:CubicO group peptidase (beta-lactamase class C family)
VQMSEHLSWGYGVGIQRAPSGNAIFHWGRNPAVRSAMVYYPGAGIGVVVLANSGTAGDAVGEIALRAVGGPAYWIEE